MLNYYYCMKIIGLGFGFIFVVFKMIFMYLGFQIDMKKYMFISLISLRYKMIIDCLKYVNIMYLLLIFGYNYNL